jgi:hypothetical protein
MARPESFPTIVPRNPVVRVIATAWLLASIVLLFVTLLRPEIQANERAALSTLVPLYFLSLPLGHLGVMALNKIKLILILDFSVVPAILAEGLALWAALSVLGYLQWFILTPAVARGFSHLARMLFKRDPAR